MSKGNLSFKKRQSCRFNIASLAIAALFLATTSVGFAAKDIDYSNNISTLADKYTPASLRHKVGKGFKIKGFKLTDSVYLARSKFTGKRDFGLVIDNGSYVYTVSAKRVSLGIHF